MSGFPLPGQPTPEDTQLVDWEVVAGMAVPGVWMKTAMR